MGTDISLDQEYQIPPIADLDILIDPLPEFLDAMEWEPEIELQSDDNDSEYNVTAEEYHSEGDQGSLSLNYSRDMDSGAEDSEDQKTYDDSLRRSKRKKMKAEAEIMTSSGRRVKRRNLDECDDNLFRNNNRSRKLRIDRKASRKKKSSLSNSLRPQRAAARNALNLFSRITGKSTDADDEDGLEHDSSESESILDDSNDESEESEASLENELNEHSKGKEVLLDVPEDVVSDHYNPESHVPDRSMRKIVFKFSSRDSNKLLPLENKRIDARQSDVVGSSSTAPQGVDEVNRNDARDPSYASADGNGVKTEINENGQPVKIVNRLSLLEGYEEGKIRWGGVKSRSSKRSRMGEPAASDPRVEPGSGLDAPVKIGTFDNGHSRSEKECFTVSSSSELQNDGGNMDEMVRTNLHCVRAESLEVIDVSNNQEVQSNLAGRRVYDEKVDDSEAPLVPYKITTNSPLKLKEKSTVLPTKLRIRSRVLSRDQENPTNIKIKSSEDPTNSVGDVFPESQSEVPSDNWASTGVPVGTQLDRTSGSVSEDSQKLHSRDRMFIAVYQRSKSVRARGNLESDGGPMEASTSNAGKSNIDEGNEAANQGIRRTRSMGLRPTSRDFVAVSNNVNLRAPQNSSEDASTSIEERSAVNKGDELPREEWRSSSRVNVGLRSGRSRRGSHYSRESPPGRRKSNQPAKSSWLMLSMHEEDYRYIPQLGDEVVYLRQGHQEYIDNSHSREVGPWKKIKGNIRAVEFCSVKDLEYATVPGSGESCCKMTLEFVDPTSNVAGKSFELTLPDLTDFPDFLVERSRYDAAIERKWTTRDKCQVWWKNNESENGGDWWEGRVKSVQPKSSDFPDSPWDRFSVQYKGDSRVLQHSPWELYDSGMQWEEPHIDSDVRDKLLHALIKLEQSGNKVQDRYGVQKLKQESLKTTFLNRFAVPMSLEVIRLRLENNYYRRLGAMKHDVEVMLANAETYFEKKADLFAKMERLQDWFRRTLSSL